MNDHQRKMARKAGKSCGYKHGGKVQGYLDDDEEADALNDEEDAKDREASAPTGEDIIGGIAEELGPEGVHAYNARGRATDAVRRKYGETKPERDARETDAMQQKLEDQRQRRRDFTLGRLRGT